MPVTRHAAASPIVSSRVWTSGGRHQWRPGGESVAQTHARGHLVYAAAGVLAVRSDRGTSIVPADRIAWTPAHWPHRHRAHGAADMRIVFLTATLARRLPDRPAVFRTSALAREVVLALTGPSDAGGDPDYGPAARARLHRVLVDELRETHEQPLHLPEPRDDRLRAVQRILTDSPADPRSLAELGTAVGASSRTLSRLLRAELGMTFYEWRTQLRIYRALVLLAEDHDTTRTAIACGWSNPSGFIAAFADIVGTTPGRYRAAAEPPPSTSARRTDASAATEATRT